MAAKTEGFLLRQLREERGLSRRQVAADLGISERTLIRHEKAVVLNPLSRRAYEDYYDVQFVSDRAA